MPPRVRRHFKKADPALFNAGAAHFDAPDMTPEKSDDYFVDLCRIIVGQQLSGKAARSIWNTFVGTFPRKKVTARAIVARSEEELRKTGVSYAKARALRDLAEKTLARDIAWERIDHMDDADIREELIKVKGVGPWTIEMFLMFSLAREDIFSFGDLGLQKGIQKVHGLRKKPTLAQLERLSKKWSPYRTYAALILWKVVDTK